MSYAEIKMAKISTLQEDAEAKKAKSQMYFSGLYSILYRVTSLPKRETICGVERTVIVEAVYPVRLKQSYHKREMSFDDCKNDRRATPKEKETFAEIEKRYMDIKENREMLLRQERENRLGKAIDSAN